MANFVIECQRGREKFMRQRCKRKKWPGLSLGKRAKVNHCLFSRCILTLSCAKPLFFSYLCAIWLFFHIGGTQDRNPRQDVAVLASTVQLLHTKETPQFWVTHCFRKEVQVVRRSVTVAITDSSTGGELVFNKYDGDHQQWTNMNKLRVVQVSSGEGWTPGALWLLLRQARWTSLFKPYRVSSCSTAFLGYDIH